MRKQSLQRGAAAMLAAVLVVALLLAAPRADGTAPARPAADQRAGLPDVVSADLDTDGVRDYWTADRMRAALPLDLDPLGRLINPRASGGGGAPAPRATTLTAPRSTGKLFFRTPQGDAVCSAASVNTAQRNVIITAGHCAHTGPRSPCGLFGNCPQYFSRFLFVPRYTNGRAPFGSWVGTRAITHREWIASEDLDRDQALIEVASRNGRRLVDVVGGNGLAWNFPPRESDISVWGWPAESPYDGETVKRCTGTTTSRDSSGDAFIRCPLTGGASGGPWFIGMTSSNVGFIWAVTSRRTTVGTPYLLAHPLDSSIRRLLSNARVYSRTPDATTPTVSNPATLASYPRTSGSSRLSLSAARSSVGRGQRAVLRARASADTSLLLDVRFSRTGAWSRVTSGRTSSTGALDFRVRVVSVGDRWYRVRSATARTSGVRIRVYPCPLPYDRTPSVVDATVCTNPVG